MKPRILVFPNFRSPSAQGKYSRLLISVYISGLAWTTRIACFFAENQFSLILLPDALRNLVPGSTKVVFYGDFFGDAEAALTYEALHRYADEIDQKMLENNLFTESHQSLARISETRWIAWINDNILLDLKILEIAIERFGKSRVQMVGAPNFPVFSARQQSPL